MGVARGLRTFAKTREPLALGALFVLNEGLFFEPHGDGDVENRPNEHAACEEEVVVGPGELGDFCRFVRLGNRGRAHC